MTSIALLIGLCIGLVVGWLAGIAAGSDLRDRLREALKRQKIEMLYEAIVEAVHIQDDSPGSKHPGAYCSNARSGHAAMLCEAVELGIMEYCEEPFGRVVFARWKEGFTVYADE